MCALKIFFTWTVQQQWYSYGIEFDSAYLSSILEEPIHFQPPPGLESCLPKEAHEGHV